MAYVTPEQFLDRYDARDVGDLVSKDEFRVEGSALLNNSKLNSALEDASAIVRSGALVGRKYIEEELQQLAKDKDAFLVQIVCDLTLGRLITGRSLTAEVTPDVLRAEEWVALLRLGERIFNVLKAAGAGLTTSGFITRQRRSELRLINDVASPRFFPNREVRFVS